jgi:hypothetical protein
MTSTFTRTGRMMTDTVSGGAQSAPVDQLKTSFQGLANVLIDNGAKTGLRAVDRLSGELEGIASREGALTGAAGGGLKAIAEGRNPLWGALKGWFTGLRTGTKVLIVLALVLALVLAPVVLLLGLLVWAVVAAVRSQRPT